MAEKAPAPKAQEKPDWVSFYHDVRNGNLDGVRHACDVMRWQTRLSSDKNALHLAAYYGHEPIVAFLLGRANVVDSRFIYQALIEACRFGHVDIAQRILEALSRLSFDWSQTDAYSPSCDPLFASIEADSLELVKIVDKSPLRKTDTNKYVQHAFYHGRRDILKYLAKKYDITFGKFGKIAGSRLIVYCALNYPERLEQAMLEPRNREWYGHRCRCLKCGESYVSLQNGDCSIFSVCARFGHLNILKFLLAKVKTLRVEERQAAFGDDMKRAVLKNALAFERLDVVRYLVEEEGASALYEDLCNLVLRRTGPVFEYLKDLNGFEHNALVFSADYPPCDRAIFDHEVALIVKRSEDLDNDLTPEESAIHFYCHQLVDAIDAQATAAVDYLLERIPIIGEEHRYFHKIMPALFCYDYNKEGQYRERLTRLQRVPCVPIVDMVLRKLRLEPDNDEHDPMMCFLPWHGIEAIIVSGENVQPWDELLHQTEMVMAIVTERGFRPDPVMVKNFISKFFVCLRKERSLAARIVCLAKHYDLLGMVENLGEFFCSAWFMDVRGLPRFVAEFLFYLARGERRVLRWDGLLVYVMEPERRRRTWLKFLSSLDLVIDDRCLDVCSDKLKRTEGYRQVLTVSQHRVPKLQSLARKAVNVIRLGPPYDEFQPVLPPPNPGILNKLPPTLRTYVTNIDLDNYRFENGTTLPRVAREVHHSDVQEFLEYPGIRGEEDTDGDFTGFRNYNGFDLDIPSPSQCSVS